MDRNHFWLKKLGSLTKSIFKKNDYTALTVKTLKTKKGALSNYSTEAVPGNLKLISSNVKVAEPGVFSRNLAIFLAHLKSYDSYFCFTWGG